MFVDTRPCNRWPMPYPVDAVHGGDAGMIVLSNLKIDTSPCDAFSGPFPIAYSKEENPAPSGSGDGAGETGGPGPGEYMAIVQYDTILLRMHQDERIGTVHDSMCHLTYQDNGMIFMSNMFVDTRPCNNEPMPYPVEAVRGRDAGMIPLSSLNIDTRPCDASSGLFPVAYQINGRSGPEESGGGVGRVCKLELVFLHVEKPLYQDAGMIILSSLNIDTRPCEEDMVDVVAVMESSGPVPNKESKKKKAAEKPKVRTDFPETWLWTEEKLDGTSGEKVLEVTVPDTITTWHVSGFALSDQTGLGIANPAEIIGFKQVFVSMNLPYSVIRGEIVTLPIVIFNYMPDCLHTKVSMKDTKDFRSLTRSHASFCTCGGSSARVLFKIIPKILGRIEIEAQVETMPTNICPKHVKFDSNSYIDIVRKKLLVEPEGIEKEYTYNSLICPRNDSQLSDKAKLVIPDKVVPGSVYSELRVIGDLMGPSLSNIDNLLKMPYGCGEQNMLNFAPNIFIMQYLKATGQLTKQIRDKAEGYTLQGYQRELTYKHKDGSYSAFGERDKEGSMWLTAFVLKSFAQARPFIEIDKKILSEAKRWIISKQSRDGCFPTIGTLHHKGMKGGVKSPVTLTGYVVIALLEADMPPFSRTIRLAVNKCIKPNLGDIKDSYSLAILSYAMAKAQLQEEYKTVSKMLSDKAIKKGGMRHWEAGKPKEDKKDGVFYSPYRQARSADIEMTSYALLSLLPENDKSKALDSVDIVRWLAAQRNSLGGWSSTQDTVLAMQALAVYAEMVFSGETDMSVSIATQGLNHKFSVNSKNNLVLQRIQLPSKYPAVLKTTATGKGCALLSASVKYNVDQVKEVPSFALTVDIKPVKSKKRLRFGRCRSQIMKICAKWLKKGDSNMAIIAVKMLSGFAPVTSTLDKALKKDRLLKEYEKKNNEWIFYYSRIDDVCLSFIVKQENIVQGMKPSSVTVYDYYDKDMSATTKYKVSAKNCK
eukprot:gene9950-10970_t